MHIRQVSGENVGELQAVGSSGDWTVQSPTVLHSGFGRLRVHLPQWDGESENGVVDQIRGLPAVTGAQANSVTRNVLILFEPQHTNSDTLLQALTSLRFEQLPASEPAILTLHEPNLVSQQEETVYVTGTTRVIYKALGWGSVGMAVVGAILPGIPTAPFVILAGYFFIRSSPEAHQWLRESRWFGPILRDWEQHRGIRRSIRNFAVALIGGSMILTLLLGLPAILTATIVACQVIGLAIVLRLRVVEPAELEPAPTVALLNS